MKYSGFQIFIGPSPGPICFGPWIPGFKVAQERSDEVVTKLFFRHADRINKPFIIIPNSENSYRDLRLCRNLQKNYGSLLYDLPLGGHFYIKP